MVGERVGCRTVSAMVASLFLDRPGCVRGGCCCDEVERVVLLRCAGAWGLELVTRGCS